MKAQPYIPMFLASLLLGGTVLLAEPGDFGVNGAHAWKEHSEQRIKHTDSFGDTYYTYSYKKPKQCITDAVKKYSQRVKDVPEEILTGLQATFDAERALKQKQYQSAEKDLAHAQTLFRAAFKAVPELDWVPIDIDIIIDDTMMSNEMISRTLSIAKSEIDKHRTQEARALLMPLKDEMVVTTLYLPSARYADAVKKALDALKQGKHIEATQALAAASGLMMSDSVTVPIPLLESESLISRAAELKKPEKKDAVTLLDKALYELKKAELLGYTDKHSQAYNALTRQIREIQERLNGGSSADELYNALKKDFGTLLDKVEGSIPFVGS